MWFKAENDLQSDNLQYLFFFQAEDGIRDDLVTGVQTCALPISELKRWLWYAPIRRLPFERRGLFSKSNHKAVALADPCRRLVRQSQWGEWLRALLARKTILF